MILLPAIIAVQVSLPVSASQITQEDESSVTLEKVKLQIENMRKTTSGWTFSDMLNRGRLAFLDGAWGEATAFFETSSTMDGISVIEKGAAWLMQAITTRFCAAEIEDEENRKREYIESAMLLNKAQMTLPNDIYIAAERVLAWKLADDPFQLMMAKQHLHSLDGSITGTEEVAGLLEGITVICLVVKTALAVIEAFNPGFLEEIGGRMQILDGLDAILESIGILIEARDAYINGPLPSS